jgi:hypothetical protein
LRANSRRVDDRVSSSMNSSEVFTLTASLYGTKLASILYVRSQCLEETI